MNKLFSVFLFFLIFIASCDETNDSASDKPINDSSQTIVDANVGEAQIMEPEIDDEVLVLENKGVTLTEIKAEPVSASLTLNTNSFKEGINHLNFAVEGVKNYNISYLANNYYLTQFSSDVFEMEFMYGNNVFLAYLTDPKGIAIKSNKGCVLKNAVVGVENMFDMNQPHLFYCQPKEETEKPILDFYLVNTSISEGGNKLRVTINQSEFVIEKWAAYEISGVSGTQNSIRIQLIDENGNLIDGPFNDSGERSFSVVSGVS